MSESESKREWPVSDEQIEVRCADCERVFAVYESEARAFYQFHRCYRSASLRYPPPERAILTDLIAEMRARHYEHTFPAVGGHPAVEGVCATCEVDCAYADWPCAHSLMADRAEARLREVGGDDADV